MIASSVALLVVSPVFVAYEYFTFRQTMVTDLSTLAEIIGDRSTAALAFENKSDAEEELYALAYKKNVASAALYDKDGQLLAFYPPTAKPGSFPKTFGSFDKPHFGPNRLILFHHISNSEAEGTVYLD